MDIAIIICKVVGHKYKLKRPVTNTIREIKCSRCSKEFGMNDDVKVVLPLDKELIEFHNEILNTKDLILLNF